MYKGQKILATICARGGSKGVKNKNIRKLNGKPLICYTLDLVKKSKLIDDYVISTDSEDIMKVVKKYGFKIYFKRPAPLAGDKVHRTDAIKHAVLWMEKNKTGRSDIVVDLGVATPLKSVTDMENSIKMLVKYNLMNVFSVAPCDRNPYYNMVEEINGRISIVKKTKSNLKDRRDAPKVFNANDGILVWKRDVLFSKELFFNKRSKMYIMPRERSVDIDEESDFIYAEYLLKSGFIKKL
ncbi:MAG: acylneuraminate cytidylyltransferase family protein [Elusimicrobia bacterium]|nr:acylneuraminate cytidylyltransferase family protein [Elusimicrobiota bacterium]